MPALVRGGRRDSQKPAPRKAKPARGGRPIPAGKLHAVKSVGLSPQATGAAVIALLLLGRFVGFFFGGAGWKHRWPYTGWKHRAPGSIRAFGSGGP